MSFDLIKPRGSFKASNFDAGGAVVNPVPYFGIVKDNIDPTRSGRLRVYLLNFSDRDQNDSKNWIPVNYMSPFFGMTKNTGAKNNYGDANKNSNSYGMWNSPPDVGSIVICVFIGGDINYGFYIGCVPDADALHMVPAIGSNRPDPQSDKENVILNDAEAERYGGAVKLPVVNANSNNPQIDDPTFLNMPKPLHSYQASIYFNQGLLRDTIRGPITSSAQRESPSRVGWGVSTPGRPVYEGGFTDQTVIDAAGNADQQSGLTITSRRGGHSIVMDDGDLVGRDQLIRLRTAMGHQILMSDDGQTLFIIHSNGKSWIELGKEGTIDMYATNSVNIRTQGDLNLHADRDVNINAKRNLNLKSEGQTQLNAEDNLTMRTSAKFTSYSTGDYTVKADSSVSLSSTNSSSLKSDGVTYINGSVVNLNTGESSVVPEEPPLIPIVAHTDTLWDSVKGWLAAPAKLLSIVSRAPAHTPWTGAGYGVDAEVKLAADSSYPSEVSDDVARANDESVTPDVPTSETVISTVPPTTGTEMIDAEVISAMAGATSTAIASGPAAIASKAGAAVVTASDGTKQLAVGALGFSPSQLVSSGDIKPGADILAQKMINAGITDPNKILPPNVFTGRQVGNLNELSSSVKTQMGTFTNLVNNSQQGLIKAGVLTGKENGGSVAGIVLAAATTGVKAATDFIKTGVSGVANITNKFIGSVKNAVSSGNFAANLTKSAGPLSAITSSLGGMVGGAIKGITGLANAAKGAAASAYEGIKAALPKLKPNEPQDLKKITEEAVNKQENANFAAASANVNNLLTSATSGIRSVVSSVGSGITNLINSSNGNTVTSAISSGIGFVAGSINNIGATINKGIGSVKSLLTNSSGPAGLLGSISSAGNKLSNIVKDKLPAGISAQINSTISSLSSGKNPIGLPKLAEGTDDVTKALENASKALVGAKVPVPLYGGNPATFGNLDTSALEKRGEVLNQVQQLRDKSLDMDKEIRDAIYEYEKAKQEYQPGDSETVRKYEILIQKQKEQREIQKQIDELLKQ